MDDADDEGPSRRQAARRVVREAGERSAQLAIALMKLTPSALAKLELEPDVAEAATRAQRTRAPVARRREERGLAQALRRSDLAAIAARLAQLQATGSVDARRLHQAEAWRERLIADAAAAATLCTERPGVDAGELGRLVDAARRERTSGRPPGAGRALFRYLHALLGEPHAEP